MWTLEKNSFYGRFYRWAYNTEKMPRSFCPFFWSSLLALLLSPMILISKIVYDYVIVYINKYYVDKHNDKYKNASDYDRYMNRKNYVFTKGDRWSLKVMFSVMVFGILSIVLHIIAAYVYFFIDVAHGNFMSPWLPAVITLSLIFGGVAFAVFGLTKTINFVSKNTSNFFSMLWSMIKGLGKYCPTIEWK